MAVLESIRNRFAARQQDAEAKYLVFVSDTATGCGIDDATLFSAITDAGRTREDFIRDVERLTRRAGAKRKFDEAERLKPACLAACLQTGEAMRAVEIVRVKSQKLVETAIHFADEKSAVSRELQSEIRELERQAHEDLMTTADPSLQAEIDQLEARCRDIHYEQQSVGRTPGCDPAEAIKAHHKLNAEEARLQERIEELRLQQIA